MKPTPKCARECVDNKEITWRKDKHYGQGGYSICQQGDDNAACADKMAQEIYANGPITGMFFVHQSFRAYKSGVYHVRRSALLLAPSLAPSSALTRKPHRNRR